MLLVKQEFLFIKLINMPTMLPIKIIQKHITGQKGNKLINVLFQQIKIMIMHSYSLI